MSDNTLIQTENLGATLALMSRRYSDSRKASEIDWTGSFENYCELVSKKPGLARNAYQRLYDMIMLEGTEMRKSRFVRRQVPHYFFFDDKEHGGAQAIFGIDFNLDIMMKQVESASRGYGQERRAFLLLGPVGSAKSTIASRLKAGLEAYSYIPDGALHSFSWKSQAYFGFADPERTKKFYDGEWFGCPMREDPLKLIPMQEREVFLKSLGITNYEHLMTELCPACFHVYEKLLKQYDGDFLRMIRENIQVERFTLSEARRVGIATFQPKDEKNQDSTELTGEVSNRNEVIFGSDTDPRAFNFNGEFQVSHRGIIEFVEVLKLDVAFLYDLLGATQEHKIKPKKFAQTALDTVIICHTNEPEYRKFIKNEGMEALRDRTIRITIPYGVTLAEEEEIYKRDYGRKFFGRHIAPYTFRMAAAWALLTRLKEPKHHGLSLLQKMQLYNGKNIPGFTEDNVVSLREEAENEGMSGVSPRVIQTQLANALVTMGDKGEALKCVNPFMVLRQIEEVLKDDSKVGTEEDRKRYKDLLAVIKDEYSDLVKRDVQMAISADEDALLRLSGNYIDNVKAYTQREKIKNKFTGNEEQPDERLMRSIEEKIDIPETRKDDFRREIMNYIGALALDGKKFDYKKNERLTKAFELKLFEDQKDTIKLTSLVSTVIDKDTQEKIDIVKARLEKNGYCDVCATDVLQYVASIFARGDQKAE